MAETKKPLDDLAREQALAEARQAAEEAEKPRFGAVQQAIENPGRIMEAAVTGAVKLSATVLIRGAQAAIKGVAQAQEELNGSAPSTAVAPPVALSDAAKETPPDPGFFSSPSGFIAAKRAK